MNARSATAATKGRILVGMSGGVDSSVAAALLAEDGYEVTGATLKLWGGESDSGCCSVADVEDARRVCDTLGIDHHVFNFGDEFNAHVVDPYVADHEVGRTPNPCIECNRHLKFDRFLSRARALGFERIATGHHARIVERPDGSRRIGRGADTFKDQSYVLYMLDQPTLAAVELPLGAMTKDQVRAKATEIGLRTANKPDSQDVCFITAAAGRETFLGDRIPLRPGRVIDNTGDVVGQVDSVQLVTIGQRRGLNTAGGGAPRYVVDVDPANDTITVGDRDALNRPAVELSDLVWSHPDLATFTGPVLAQTRAHGHPQPGHFDGATITWDEPQQRVAPGQSVVLYDNNEVLGGGLA